MSRISYGVAVRRGRFQAQRIEFYGSTCTLEALSDFGTIEAACDAIRPFDPERAQRILNNTRAQLDQKEEKLC